MKLRRIFLLTLGTLAIINSSYAQENKTKELNPPQGEEIIIPNPKEYGREKLNAVIGKKAVQNPSKIHINDIQREDYYRYIQTITSIDNNQPVDATIKTTKTNGSVSSGMNEKATISSSRNTMATTNTKEQIYLLKGNCYIDRNIDMTTIAMPIDIDCIFENGKTGKVYGNLVSDFKTFSLLLKPYRVIFSDGVSYAVKSGVVYNADRTTINVADEVNKQYLKRVFASALQSGLKSSFDAYQEYVENRDTTTYVAGNSGTVVQEKRIPKNYPIVAGILGAVSGAVDSIMNFMKSEFQSIPVLFKINAGKTLYVELYVTPENVKVLGGRR
jgi:hypothetical protein